MTLKNIKSAAICITLLSAVSCTSDFENINSNPQGASNEQLEQDYNTIKAPFSPMFANVFVLTAWPYQIQQNLQGDIWSGYMATGSGFANGNNPQYKLNNGWNNQAWDNAYRQVMASALKVKQQAEARYPEFYDLSLIIKVEAMHRITDIYGPCVYSSFGKPDTTVFPYDSQKLVYDQMFADLDTAIKGLTPIAKANAAAGKSSLFATTDVSSYHGDYTKWVKYANSLRLRLAMRIVKIDPAKAKTEAESAVNHEFGVLSTKADIFTLEAKNYSNPISDISQGWGDIKMSADMESIMGGYQDPRLSAFFLTSSEYPGTYKGIRTGITIVDKSDHVGFSSVNIKTTVWMTTAEVYFLRAEGALRGWNMGGTAQGLYETGITQSFEQHGVSGVSNYLTNTNVAKNYVDPTNAANNGNAVNLVTVSWSDGAATNEVKLQKIITQKWIANFPEGQEAWSEYRRTGYPMLLPVLVNASAGTVTTQYGMRRINFVDSEKAGNPEGVKTGLAELGGPDNGGTRLWWDTTGPNF
ncbi:RagB/SusD family nutrient uptake outer membrane protein [Flavobacterium sp. N3904]|uniref:RagB/SusD family nutrient uptake outer membrane protein n=1 Tax=Flavobacterium sp. N3904 TaxID=2986835 RepID=UPI0022257776|nr:RagB/SusD family nutrient uptake outer membrane protein [Flavobacterium sp. N3904]